MRSYVNMPLRHARVRTALHSWQRNFAAVADKPTPVLPLKVVQNPVVQKALPLVGNSAYLMLAGGFLMTDILWLRLLLVGGYSGLVCYHGFQLRPLRIPLAGSFFFVVVNGVKTVHILRERFVRLTEEESRIYYEHFESAMSAFEFKNLLSYGKIVTADGRQELVRKGEPADLVLIIEGRVEVHVADGVVIDVDKAGLIGECSFMSGDGASASCFSTKGCRYIIWNGQQLHDILQHEAAVKHGLEFKIGRELLRKLSKTTEQLVRDQSTLAMSSSKLCVCGHSLEVDSRFCRKCGKKREELPES